jgi:hypothetical protein
MKYSHASLLIFIVYLFLWFILLIIVSVNKKDDKPKYKTKKEYAFVEPTDWASDLTMNDTKKEFLEYLNK